MIMSYITPVIPDQILRPEDCHKFKVILSYRAKPCLNKTKTCPKTNLSQASFSLPSLSFTHTAYRTKSTKPIYGTLNTLIFCSLLIYTIAKCPDFSFSSTLQTRHSLKSWSFLLTLIKNKREAFKEGCVNRRIIFICLLQ